MMSGKEKLYFLLDAIDDARAIAPSGQPLIIDPANDLNLNYRDVELSQLFTKLEKDEQVLKVLQVPSRIKTIDIVEDLDPYDHADDGCWHIELLPAFDSYFLKIQQEPEYQEFTGKKPLPKPQEPNVKAIPVKDESDVICWVTFTQTREILLNDVFLIGKPDFDSENEVVFGYLYNNPDRTITLDELKEKLKRDITKTLHKIVENLGFKGDIKNLFFNISKSSIKFKKQITQKDLDELGLKRIRLYLK